MNLFERKNVLFRLVAAVLLLTDIGLAVFATLTVINFQIEGITLALIATVLTGAFALLQSIFTLKGWKKESFLYKICFNDNKKVNTAPLIAVSIGTLISLTLLILSLVIWFTKSQPKDLTSVLVIMVVAVYLLANCIIYYFYLFLFRDKPINLKDFIK